MGMFCYNLHISLSCGVLFCWFFPWNITMGIMLKTLIIEQFQERTLMKYVYKRITSCLLK